MKYCELVLEFKNSQLVFQLIYFFSKKVVDIESYSQHRGEEIDFSYSQFKETIEKIQKNQIPLERITEKTTFCNREFFVDPKVFIPKWETEEIVAITQQYLSEYDLTCGDYVDICAGTGVIGISNYLKNKSHISSLTMVDICPHAIQNIHKNINLLSVSAQVIQEDWHSHLQSKKYSLITANFPYVSHQDEYDSKILQHEPHQALFADNDGWFHYQQLLTFIQENQHWNLIICECNEHHLEMWKQQTKSLKQFKFHFLSDSAQKFRFTVIINTNNLPK